MQEATVIEITAEIITGQDLLNTCKTNDTIVIIRIEIGENVPLVLTNAVIRAAALMKLRRPSASSKV